MDSITLQSEENKLKFEPFVGVGPRSFFNLFSVNLGTGYPIKRKNDDGTPVEWSPKTARLRMQMLPSSYIDRETANTVYVKRTPGEIKMKNNIDLLAHLKGSEAAIKDWPAWKTDIWPEVTGGHSAMLPAVKNNPAAKDFFSSLTVFHRQK